MSSACKAAHPLRQVQSQNPHLGRESPSNAFTAVATEPQKAWLAPGEIKMQLKKLFAHCINFDRNKYR